ncbi:DEAD/DEAH box helicase [Leucobacter coleopterorum]|uniref:DEAD/DEAH box helicase n=1 Tax=Leucobacter coleopterorum TaxID=2714933 RepID=UPI001FCA59D1|nr:DEAD/DEAH box helicase [Leucobacter coleopterorum]
MAALDQGKYPRDPVIDLIRRTPPRLATANAGESSALGTIVAADDDPITAVTEAVLRLDRSYLAVQGPPGTGKTYLATRVIKRLAQDYGWRIGVVAQSHRVVEHVLEGVVAAGLSPRCVAKVPQGGALAEGASTPPYSVLRKNGHSVFLQERVAEQHGCVIGGTAWDFANHSRVARRELDLLVIDEAGQFSLAPTIAASVSAQRLLLLGDPQQLPQVSQGSHPEPVDTSALAWLLGEHETMPDELGVFLAETRRMRPELTEVVSELAYEGRLRAHPTTTRRSVASAGLPGLTWHPVMHTGNSTSSPEEAAVVVRLANRMLLGELTEAGRDPRSLTQNDLIVVAAYNAQVECVAQALAGAGLDEIRVGTVDKFQGQEAAVAIVTLAASSAEDVPRGLEFLLLRNRLNVAISRAQWAAHLVSSALLGDGLPSSAEGVAALSGYLRLTERGAHSEVTPELMH